jgi:hypothetical protein
MRALVGASNGTGSGQRRGLHSFARRVLARQSPNRTDGLAQRLGDQPGWAMIEATHHRDVVKGNPDSVEREIYDTSLPSVDFGLRPDDRRFGDLWNPEAFGSAETPCRLTLPVGGRMLRAATSRSNRLFYRSQS